MGYSSVGNRPFEYASKSSHHHIINDAKVAQAIDGYWIPPGASTIPLEEVCIDHVPPAEGRVETFVAVDGGYSEVFIRKEFPSATLHFLQFGALLFKRDDLAKLDEAKFISPEDMARLKNIERLKLALPTKGVRGKNDVYLRETYLRAVYEFFKQETLGESQSLLDTLAWFVFRRYKQGTERGPEDGKWFLSSNPRLFGSATGLSLDESAMRTNFTFPCPVTGKDIYLTDIFRLHEAIDEERGAGGTLGYLMNVVEHVVILHIIRQLLDTSPDTVSKLLFIKDGPTGFFGETARLSALMSELVGWLLDHHGLCMAGLEKSGAFVDHAREIAQRMKPGTIIVLTDDYIYGNILPGTADPNRPYAATSNYGQKVIFKTRGGQMHVVSLPVRQLLKKPAAADIPNLHEVLSLVEALNCDMYDSALIPVALVNKLVSLSAHPSTRILEKFARANVAA